MDVYFSNYYDGGDSWDRMGWFCGNFENCFRKGVPEKPKMNYSEFISLLEKKGLPNSVFFCGSEDFLIEDCLQRITHTVDPATRDFNFDVYYGSQVDGGKIVDTASAYPMLAESRLVIVKEVNKLSGAGLEALAKYLERQSSTTRLVLIAEKITARNKSWAKIKSNTCFVEFKQLYDNQVMSWMEQYLRGRGYEITSDASILVHSRVGNNLRAIANELNKILLNLNGEKRIAAEDVQGVVGLSRTFSVFHLTDAIGNREIENALQIMSKMLDSGESHTGMLAMITRHFVSLLVIKGAVRQKKSDNEIAALAGIAPYFVKKNKTMAAKYSFRLFENVFVCLLETDLKLKTSQQPPKIALQTMLVQILQQD